MKLLLSLIFLSQFTFANDVSKAFKIFFNNELISPIHCGKNIFHFLNYLDQKNIKYSSGYVVSVHEPGLLGIKHFDARWGKTQSYKNSQQFNYSKWYFHVFAIIDDIAYDFSQAGAKTMSAREYLNKAYLPQYTTEKMLFMGEYTKQKAYKDSRNIKLNLYQLQDYKNDYGPVLYQGVFSELFNYHDDIDPTYSDTTSNNGYKLAYNNAYLNNDNSITIEMPKLTVQGYDYPLIANPFSICRAFGYLGSLNSMMSYEISNDVTALKLTSSLTRSSSRYISSDDITLGWSVDKTIGSVETQPLFHYASTVTCSDLHSVLINL